MKRKALVLLCMGMILTGMTGCSAGIRIAESTQDNIMVIMENPADGSAEESGSGEEESNTDISGTTDFNEEAEADQKLHWKDAYKALMKELVNGNFGEDLPFFGYLPGDPEYDQLMEYGYGVNGYYLYDVDKDGVPELVVKLVPVKPILTAGSICMMVKMQSMPENFRWDIRQWQHVLHRMELF